MEAFLSEHSYATIDDVLYGWPATKFEALYEAYCRRKVADELSNRRALEIAAVWGNTNLDQENEKDLRQKLQEQIDESYSNSIASVYGELEQLDATVDYDSDPFFAAAKRGMEKRKLPDPQIGE